MDHSGAVNPPQGPWYLRTSARTVGAVAGVGCLVLGFICVVTSLLSPMGIVAGICEIIVGMILVSLEAPFLCNFMSFLSRLANFWEGRPHWHKAAFYGILGIFPIALSIGITTGLGSAAVWVTAFLYGSMAMGKRGADAVAPPAMTGDLGYGQMDRSGLVESGMYNQNKAGAY